MERKTALEKKSVHYKAVKPRVRHRKKSKRVNVWLPEKSLKVASQIANFSAFVQICLDIAPDVMVWATMKNHDPKTWNTGREMKDVKDAYNKAYPQKVHKAKAKEIEECRKDSQIAQEIW